ncbi:hypothetical protein [Streptomyces sp. SID3343]|uniref:hypothetical protein n=1 Tax=Streptomyces sp. SID3343 TaxID=2690260 RepID=UPI00137219D6|nr:hypothetical protein [Streptomyces sp. SID3343]MYW01128.1 hypothetical protein [Streptomyces sp. SID3343]
MDVATTSARVEDGMLLAGRQGPGWLLVVFLIAWVVATAVVIPLYLRYRRRNRTQG